MFEPMVTTIARTTGAVRPAALSRRRFLALSGSLAGGAILAACGGSSATNTPQAATPQTAATATGASAAPTTAATVASSAASGSPVSPTRAAGSAPASATSAGTTAASTTAAGTSATGTGVTGTRAAGSAVTGTAATNTGVVGPRPTGSATTGSPVTGTAAAGTPGTVIVGQALSIEAVEYAYRTLGSIPAGLTTVQLRNLGKENHEAQLVRLNEGVSIDQLIAALKQATDGPPPDIFTYEGGPAETLPNQANEVILNLRQGQYALLCFVAAPDSQPHIAKGMFLPITVTAASGAASAIPVGSGAVVLGSGTIGIPDTVRAGRTTFRVTNQDTAPRAFFVGSIPADKTPADLQQALADPSGPPPWFQANGGMDGLSPGVSGAVILNLTPGKYAAVDVPYGDSQPAGKIFTVS